MAEELAHVLEGGRFHPDLFEATCGGMGLTGMITRVKFKLKKIPSSYIKQKQIKATNLDELIRLFEEYKHFTYSMAWIDCLKKGNSFGRGIMTIGEFATPEELNEKQRQAPLALPAERAGEEPRTVTRDVVWVSVSDTGVGIQPADMPKLFLEFSQVDSSASRQAQGTGLGLALCRKFVEMHGGTIGAESVPGRGTTFWFLLPT